MDDENNNNEHKKAVKTSVNIKYMYEYKLKQNAQNKLNIKAFLRGMNLSRVLYNMTIDKYCKIAFNSVIEISGNFKAMNGISNNGYPGPFHKFISGAGGE